MVSINRLSFLRDCRYTLNRAAAKIRKVWQHDTLIRGVFKPPFGLNRQTLTTVRSAPEPIVAGAPKEKNVTPRVFPWEQLAIAHSGRKAAGAEPTPRLEFLVRAET